MTSAIIDCSKVQLILFIAHYCYLKYWSICAVEKHVKMLSPRKFDYLNFNKVTLLRFQITDIGIDLRQYDFKRP